MSRADQRRTATIVRPATVSYLVSGDAVTVRAKHLARALVPAWWMTLLWAMAAMLMLAMLDHPTNDIPDAMYMAFGAAAVLAFALWVEQWAPALADVARHARAWVTSRVRYRVTR